MATNTQAPHTRGPWTWDGEDHETLSDFTRGVVRGPSLAAVVGPATVMRKSDARLIAAAPELLEALREIVERVEDHDAIDAALKRARAAIRKAVEP